MTQHFLSLSPKTEKWNWQKEFVSFHEIECMYVPCKRIHSVSHMSNINGILLLFACHKEGFRPWIPITLKGLSINDIGNWEGVYKSLELYGQVIFSPKVRTMFFNLLLKISKTKFIRIQIVVFLMKILLIHTCNRT